MDEGNCHSDLSGTRPNLPLGCSANNSDPDGCRIPEGLSFTPFARRGGVLVRRGGYRRAAFAGLVLVLGVGAVTTAAELARAGAMMNIARYVSIRYEHAGHTTLVDLPPAWRRQNVARDVPDLLRWLLREPASFPKRRPPSEPIVRSVFDVYLDGGRLIYVKDRCTPADVMETRLFLSVTPVNQEVAGHAMFGEPDDILGRARKRRLLLLDAVSRDLPAARELHRKLCSERERRFALDVLSGDRDDTESDPVFPARDRDHMTRDSRGTGARWIGEEPSWQGCRTGRIRGPHPREAAPPHMKRFPSRAASASVGGSSQDAGVSPVAKFQDRYPRWERLLHRLAFSTVEAHIALGDGRGSACGRAVRIRGWRRSSRPWCCRSTPRPSPSTGPHPIAGSARRKGRISLERAGADFRGCRIEA